MNTSADFRWGILGTGNIAAQFAGDVAQLPGHRVSVVASRSGDRAQAFCGRFGGTPVDGYDELLDDPGIDAVYVSLPNTLHAEWAIKALSAGHHVLCEKPLATSAAEAETMFAAADRAGRVLAEAFMYRCHPQTRAVVDAVRTGRIGDVTHVRASFCYRTTKLDGNVRFRPDLAGGALMDVGCYCLDAILLFGGGDVASASAVRRVHERGVDAMTTGVVLLDNGVCGTFACGLDTQCDNALVIAGTEGFIHVPVPWKPGPDAAFAIRGTPRPRQELGDAAPPPPPNEQVATPADLPLYALEADAFAKQVRGQADAFMPRDASLRLARLTDAVRGASQVPAARS